MKCIHNYQDKYKTKWDDYIKQSPTGTFFHLTKWKEVMEKTFGFKSIYLIALNDSDEIEGVLPLFKMNDIFGKEYLISIPSANYAGICASDKTVRDELLNRAKEISIEYKVQYLEIRQLADKVYDLPTKKDYVTMFLKLDNDEELVWSKSLNSKARNQVRKAYREGLTVDIGKEYFNEFYNVLSTNIRDLGTPIYPKYFFENILEEFGDLSDIIVVKYKNTVIGGMLYIGYKKVLTDTWASSLKQYNRLCPNNILYWEAIKHACKNGFEFFDLGRSTINSGTYKFKKQWGAEPVQLHYQYFLNEQKSMPSVNVNKIHYQLVINMWKKLPLSVANILGPRLNRYLIDL